MDWNSLQIAIAIFLQNLGEWLDIPMRVFSFLGTEEFFLFIMPGLYWCISPSLGIRTAIALLFSSSLNASLKLVFHLPRPYWVDTRVLAYSSETSFGLPSNHAQNAVIIWGLLGKASRKSVGFILAFLLMFLIGLSRLYLGVHFLGDVIVGWITGGLLLIFFFRFDHPISAWIARQPLNILLACAAGGSLVVTLLPTLPGLALQTWPVPTEWVRNALLAAPLNPIDPLNLDSGFSLGGTWLGMFAGCALLFHNTGNFRAGGPWLHLVFRYLIGLAGVVVLWFGLGQLFPRSADLAGFLLRYLRYCLIGLWIALFAPLLFRRLRLWMD